MVHFQIFVFVWDAAPINHYTLKLSCFLVYVCEQRRDNLISLVAFDCAVDKGLLIMIKYALQQYWLIQPFFVKVCLV